VPWQPEPDGCSRYADFAEPEPDSTDSNHPHAGELKEDERKEQERLSESSAGRSSSFPHHATLLGGIVHGNHHIAPHVCARATENALMLLYAVLVRFRKFLPDVTLTYVQGDLYL
jgi:hypothetical protein